MPRSHSNRDLLEAINARQNKDYAYDIRVAVVGGTSDPPVGTNVYPITFLDSGERRTRHRSGDSTVAFYLGNRYCLLEPGTVVAVAYISSHWWILQCHAEFRDAQPPDPPDPPTSDDPYGSNGLPCTLISEVWEARSQAFIGTPVGKNFSDPDYLVGEAVFRPAVEVPYSRPAVLGPVELYGVLSDDDEIIPDQIEAKVLNLTLGNLEHDGLITCSVYFGNKTILITWDGDSGAMFVSDGIGVFSVNVSHPGAKFISVCVEWDETEYSWVVAGEGRTVPVGSIGGENGFRLDSNQACIGSYQAFDRHECGCGDPGVTLCHGSWCVEAVTSASVNIGRPNWVDQDWDKGQPGDDPPVQGGEDCGDIRGFHVASFFTDHTARRDCEFRLVKDYGEFFINGTSVGGSRRVSLTTWVNVGKALHHTADPPPAGFVRLRVTFVLGAASNIHSEAYYLLDVPSNISICDNEFSLPLTHYTNQPSRGYYSPPNEIDWDQKPDRFGPAVPVRPDWDHVCDNALWPNDVTLRFTH